ncbi:hypothetical protein [Desulfofundulus salinus]|uniref:hypothetical protein n=1 Tax=Desulfofundulus salinus TaxID=2419843 RepID=UPI001A9B3A7D|nr:hypothetical protein [Desulfofundulus salinum]
MFDKKEFARLLNKARGDRSINQYALHSGVTAAHISRLSRALLDSPPTPQTIKKLADHAYNNVTYEDLMAAAGYLPEKEQDPNESAARTIEAAISDDPELLEFWQELVKREDLQLLFKQVKPLTPKSIKKIIKVIKAIEDAEAMED